MSIKTGKFKIFHLIINNLILVLLRVAKLNLSLKLLLILMFSIFFGDYLPEIFQSTCYTISIILKEILLSILPIIIFSCISSCFFAFESKKTIGFMLALFIIVSISNYTSTLIAYVISSLKIVNLGDIKTYINNTADLAPLFNFKLPKIISNKHGLYFGFLVGILFSLYQNKTAKKLNLSLKKAVSIFLEKCFIPILPVFSLGFILKMQHDGVLDRIIQSCFPLVITITSTYILYLAFLYAIAAEFRFSQWLRYIKNIIPVGLMGFSTMSSLATMPITLNAAEKNTEDTNITRSVIPTTVNIHLIGDSIAIPIMAITILINFGHEFPSFIIYNCFAMHFVLAKFSGAAVPGAGILIMIPVLQDYLYFSEEMSAIITTLYIIFDSVITTTNVLGNSALVIIISKAFSKLASLESLISHKFSKISTTINNIVSRKLTQQPGK